MGNGLSRFLKSTIAVENGFLAAGATIVVIAFLQSVGIVWNWLG